ncbi:TPA: SEC10/PgrA surface exclusion domain-containing protein [Streptococcus suis]|nr:SEC10/PgrA surface exclusion domain-containing protein [Streptococcus suis]HEP1790857.1 SEC10/PgrA surface exclusion domain-containing protein [Streptococcus suis]HEP1825450.1 SEC10/PgrA surface exclusion domain-containing protein [Streptococcus suis]HEP1841295.1 SEC10/PgrA surface exclusion domain-containing protein [Streptococcus suis]
MRKNNYIFGGFAATTAITLATVGTPVQAEEVTATVETATTVAEVPVTAATVQSALEVAEQAQASVDAQQIVVEAAKGSLETAEQATSQAKEQLTKAEEKVAQATPENIQNAADAVENVKTNQATKETAVQTSQDAVKEAQDAVNNQAKVVESAKKATSKEQTDVDAAQQNVDNAQAILDGTGAQAIYDAQAKAQDIVNKDKAKVDEAQSKLEAAHEADKKRQEAIDDAQRVADKAAKTLSNKTTELSTANSYNATVKAELADKQLAFEHAENNYKGIQNFVVTSDYVQALKDYVNNPYNILSEREKWDEWNEDAKTRLKAANQANVEANLKYSINLNDDNTTEYDVNNLPKDLQTELSHYASYLLNQIRTIFGTPLTTVTSSSVDFVDKSTDKSISKNWDTWTSGHDDESIWSTAVEYGLTDKNYPVRNYHENWSGTYFYDRDYDSDGFISISGREKVTKQTLKRAVHHAVISFMFNGGEWLHARSIAGLTDTSSEYVPGQGYVEKYDDVVYLGIDFTKVNGKAGVHFITVGTHDLTSDSTFDTELIENPYNIEKITKLYQDALKIRDEAQGQVDQEKLRLDSAQKEYDTALENDKDAKDALSDAQSVPVQTPAAQLERNRVQSILDASQKVLDQANADVLALEKDVKVKQSNLNKAKAELTTQQFELKSAKEVLTKEEEELIRLEGLRDKAQENLTRAETGLEEAKKAVRSAEQELLDLQNAPEKLEEAKRNYEKAQQQLKEAKETFDDASALLETLLTERDTKLSEYKELKAKFDLNQAKLKDLENQAKNKVIVTLPDGTIVAVPKIESTTEKVTYSRVERAKTLPNTGEQTSLLALAGLTVLSSLGLVSARRRKQG